MHTRPHLLLLHICSHDQHLRNGVLHFQLLYNGGCVVRHKQLVQVINDHLVHPCAECGEVHRHEQGTLTILPTMYTVPFGP